MNTIKKVIIPVAGFGTRFLPATKAQPKEMLPIVDKPIIQYLVEEAVNSGISDVIFVTGRGKRAIEDHFDSSFELEHILEKKGKQDILKMIRDISDMATFAYVRQKEAKGDGHAILSAAHLVNNEPACAILFGDCIVDSDIPCLKQMIEVYNKYQCSVIAVEEVPHDQVHQYGVIKGKQINDRVYELESIVEKPKQEEAPSNLAIIGKYIITQQVFKELANTPEQNGEIYLANALTRNLKNERVIGYQLQGKWYDCGSKIGFLKAIVDFGLKHDDTKEEFGRYLQERSKVSQ